jgi:hypothetical protein
MKLVDGLSHLTIALVLSGLYALAMTGVTAVSNPIQIALGLHDPEASILFFPHGVRVLAAYLFGWRSLGYLLPIQLTYAQQIFADEDVVIQTLAGLASQAACVLAFSALSLAGAITPNWTSQVLPWRVVMLCGCIGATFNTATAGLLHEHNDITLAMYFVGDIAGLVVVMLIAMVAFRIWRKAA